MKDRKTHKNYGKGVLSFGKYKGKTINEIIENKDYLYVLWLRDNVKRITVSDSDYAYCKTMLKEMGIVTVSNTENEGNYKSN